MKNDTQEHQPAADQYSYATTEDQQQHKPRSPAGQGQGEQMSSSVAVATNTKDEDGDRAGRDQPSQTNNGHGDMDIAAAAAGTRTTPTANTNANTTNDPRNTPPSAKTTAATTATTTTTTTNNPQPQHQPEDHAAQFSELMIRNAFLLKENRLLDSFLHRHGQKGYSIGDHADPHVQAAIDHAASKSKKAAARHATAVNANANASTNQGQQQPAAAAPLGAENDQNETQTALDALRAASSSAASAAPVAATSTTNNDAFATAAAVAARAEISAHQKYHMTVQEHEYRSKQLKRLQKKVAEDASMLRAIIKGIKIRINEMHRETYEFRRDVASGAAHAADMAGEGAATVVAHAGQPSSEAVISFFNNMLKQKAELVAKLELKNSALRAHRIKVENTLKHKMEQGNSLHSIDFHQLQIKNSRLSQTIKTRDAELLRLKMTTGKTVLVLNTTKRELAMYIERSAKLKRDMDDRRDGKIRLAKELKSIQAEIVRERKTNHMYKVRQNNPNMPQIIEYVQQKAEDYELEAAIRNWKRKVEVVQGPAKRARRTLRMLGMSTSSHQSPKGGGAAGQHTGGGAGRGGMAVAGSGAAAAGSLARTKRRQYY